MEFFENGNAPPSFQCLSYSFEHKDEAKYRGRDMLSYTKRAY
jgi:hypothetical protein